MWTINDDKPRRIFEGDKHTPVPAAGMRKYYEWRRLIHAEHRHPKDAAERVGDLNYKKLSGAMNQHEIRLTQGHRATFTINNERQHVEVLRIGGHT